MKIGSISKNLFDIKQRKAENNNHTNPFGVSFKGNIVAADVFEDQKSSINASPNKGKIFVSTLVGSMNSAMSSRLNSVVSFGRRMKERTSDLWQKANNTEINFDMTRISNYLKMNVTPSFTGTYSVANLRKRPVSELEDMLQQQLETAAV